MIIMSGLQKPVATEFEDFNVPVLELAVVGHFISHDYGRDAEVLKFLGDFPDYVFVVEWPSILKRYIY